MAQIIMIMISTTLGRRDMSRKKTLCTSPNLPGNGQSGGRIFGQRQRPLHAATRQTHANQNQTEGQLLFCKGVKVNQWKSEKSKNGQISEEFRVRRDFSVPSVGDREHLFLAPLPQLLGRPRSWSSSPATRLSSSSDFGERRSLTVGS